MTQRYTFGGGVLNIGLDEQEILKGLESNRNYISLLRKISNNLAIEIKRFTPVDTGNLRASVLPLDPKLDAGLNQQVGGTKKVLRAKYIAGVSVGASSPGGKYADLAPYWALLSLEQV